MNNIIKKNRLILLTLILIFLSAIYYYTIVYSAKDFNKVVSIHGNYVLYESLESLEKQADLIIKASPLKDFETRHHVNTYYDDGSIQDFYTKTQVEIKKVYKQPEDLKLDINNTIDIIEPVGVVEDIDNKKNKIKLTMEDYNETKVGNNYILFLMKNDQGEYVVMSSNLGKYNLEKEQKSKKHGHNHLDELHKTLNEKVLEKYKDR